MFEYSRFAYRVSVVYIFLVRLVVLLCVLGTFVVALLWLLVVEPLAFWSLVALAIILVISFLAMDIIQTSRYNE